MHPFESLRRIVGTLSSKERKTVRYHLTLLHSRNRKTSNKYLTLFDRAASGKLSADQLQKQLYGSHQAAAFTQLVSRLREQVIEIMGMAIITQRKAEYSERTKA